MSAANTVLQYRMMQDLIRSADAQDGSGGEVAHALLQAAFSAAIARLGADEVRKAFRERPEYAPTLQIVGSLDAENS